MIGDAVGVGGLAVTQSAARSLGPFVGRDTQVVDVLDILSMHVMVAVAHGASRQVGTSLDADELGGRNRALPMPELGEERVGDRTFRKVAGEVNGRVGGRPRACREAGSPVAACVPVGGHDLLLEYGDLQHEAFQHGGGARRRTVTAPWKGGPLVRGMTVGEACTGRRTGGARGTRRRNWNRNRHAGRRWCPCAPCWRRWPGWILPETGARFARSHVLEERRVDLDDGDGGHLRVALFVGVGRQDGGHPSTPTFREAAFAEDGVVVGDGGGNAGRAAGGSDRDAGDGELPRARDARHVHRSLVVVVRPATTAKAHKRVGMGRTDFRIVVTWADGSGALLDV